MSDDQTSPMARPRVAAGALFFDEEGRVLLVKPTYKEGWDIPGGYVEPGESPFDACAREVKEELSIDPPIGDLLVADWAPSPGEGDKILFVFDGGVIPKSQRSAIQLPPSELDDWTFAPPEQCWDLLPVRLVRRVKFALSAKEDAKTLYVESS